MADKDLLSSIGEYITEKQLPNIAGMVNGAMFGAPEVVLNAMKYNLGNKNAVAEMEQWKKEHPTYGAGNLGGNVASSFIPIAGLAKGAVGGAKLAAEAAPQAVKGIGKLLQPLAKAQGVESEAAKTLGGAVKTGAINAAAGEGIREGVQGEFDPAKIATAGIAGAGGGAVAKGIGKVLGAGAKALTGAGKAAASDVGVLTKDPLFNAADATIRQFGPFSAHIKALESIYNKGVGGPSKVLAEMRDWVVKSAETAKKYGLQPKKPATVDTAIAKSKTLMDEGDKILNSNIKQVQDTFLTTSDNSGKSMLSDGFTDELGNAFKRIPSEYRNAAMNKVHTTAYKIANMQSPSMMRQEINAIMDNAGNAMAQPGEAGAVGKALYDAMGIMRSKLTDTTGSILKQAGRADLADAPKEYGILNDFAKQMVQKSAAGIDNSMGSNTTLGQAIGNLVAGGSIKGTVGGLVGQSISKPIMRGIQNAQMAGRANKFEDLLAKHNAPESALGAKAAPVIESGEKLVSSKGAAVLPSANAASAVNMPSVASGSPEPSANGLIAEQLGDPGQNAPMGSMGGQSKMDDVILQKAIERYKLTPDWIAFSQGKDGQELMNDPYFKDILANLQGKLKVNGETDPSKLANLVFYNDPAGKAAFPAAYGSYKQIFGNLQEAMNTKLNVPIIGDMVNNAAPGLTASTAGTLTGITGKGSSARGAVLGGIRMLADSNPSKPAGDPEKDVEMAIQMAKTPEELQQRILSIMDRYNPTALNVLRKAGIL